MKLHNLDKLSPNDQYNFAFVPGDNRPIRVLIVVGLLFMAAFLVVYFLPQNRGSSWLFWMLTASVLFKMLRLLYEWYHYWQVKPAIPPVATRTWTVDVLTTYCPGEPIKMVVNTLQAIQQMSYPHTAYLCDEANDPYMREICRELGVIHVTRRDKIDAKAGNINNALRQATGEICVVLDPDHVPVPDFLDHVLSYFENPAVGYVQCVQGYYNHRESIVAFGAAEQTYSFYGPMMTCMSNYGTAQAIGANCTFRRAALDSIGGHASGLSEDMHTAMRLHAEGWKSTYVPLPLSYGLVPATLSAYYKQQLKWARGTFELLVTTYPDVFHRLSGRQRLHYGTLPLYYLLGTVQLIDWLIPILSLLFMQLPLQLDLLLFGTVYIPLLLTGFLIRQYAQRWLIERHEAGFHLVGGLLASGTWWVYVLGLVYTIFRVHIPYIPTPKDDRPRNNFILVLPNLLMALLTLSVIGYSIYWYGRFSIHNIYYQMMIGFGLLNAFILTMNVLAGQERALWSLANWLGRMMAPQKKVETVRTTAFTMRYGFYFWLRWASIPLFGGVLVLAMSMALFTYRKKTAENPLSLRYANTQPFYVGLTSYSVKNLGNAPVSMPVIVPYHLGWPIYPRARIDVPTLSAPTSQLPLLYIEPTGLKSRSERDMQTFFRRILQGKQDLVLIQFARQVRDYGQPVLLSFGPEFDNPRRVWGVEQETSLVLYRRVWQYVVRMCRNQKATNIAWVWCPSRPSSVVEYYPGANSVDWLGFPVVNDPAVAPDRKSHSFAALFQVIDASVRMHVAYSIRQKPILITQLRAVTNGPAARKWATEAIELILERYPHIRGIVFAEETDWRAHQANLLDL